MVKVNPYADNKELLVISDAVYSGLYDDGKDAIPLKRKLAEAADSQFGKGCSEYAVHAIRLD